MIRVEMKNYNMTLIERLQKYQLYYQVKINMYQYLTREEILPSNQQQMKQQAKFTYFPLGKAFEKQTKEQVKAIKDLNISDKSNELKQIENIFPKHVISYLIITKLKKLELQNNIELDKLNYKNYNFNKVSLPTIFLRDIQTKDPSMKNADIEQSDLLRALKIFNKGNKLQEKVSFLKNVGTLSEARQDVLNNFKSNTFLINSDTIPRETSIND